MTVPRINVSERPQRTVGRSAAQRLTLFFLLAVLRWTPSVLAAETTPKLAAHPPAAAVDLDVEPAPAPLLETPAISAASEAEVYRHVEEATEHFGKGRYADCVRSLRAAYALNPQPIFLFNIAQSFRRGQLLREALSMYRQFLAADPRTSLRAETQGYIQELTVLIERQDQLERERRKPAWRKPWFWGLIGGGVATVALGLGLGLGLGIRDERTVIDLR